MPPEDSLYLFQAPSFYGFSNGRLQAYCKHNLEHNIHVQNVLQILEASDKMNVPDIKNYALSMIVRDFSQVARLPKMQMLSRDLLLEVIEAMADVLGEIRFNQDFTSISVHSDIWNLLFSKFAINVLQSWMQRHQRSDGHDWIRSRICRYQNDCGDDLFVFCFRSNKNMVSMSIRPIYSSHFICNNRNVWRKCPESEL